MCWAKRAPPSRQSSPCCVNGSAYPALLLGIQEPLVFCAALLPRKPHGQGWRVGACVLEGHLAAQRLSGEHLVGACHISPLLSGEQHPACWGCNCRCFLRSPWYLPDLFLGHEPAGSGPLHSHVPPWYYKTCLGQLRSPPWPSGGSDEGSEGQLSEVFQALLEVCCRTRSLV